MLRRRLAPSTHSVDGGVRMQLDIQEWLQIGLLADRPQEPHTAARLRTLLRPGDTFIDIGAHVGWLSLIGAQAVGTQGRVISIDPQPYNCARILVNAEINYFNNIIVIPAAIGERDDLIELRNQRPSDKAKLSLASAGPNDTDTTFLVSCFRLDALLQRWQLERIRVVKIDVEGFERQVLEGAGATLARVDHVILEMLPVNSNEQVIELLHSQGFYLRQIDGRPWSPGTPAVEHNVWGSRREVD